MAVEKINRIIKLLANKGTFNSVFAPLQAISVDENCLKCHLQVTKTECNSLNTLHGGYIASLVDFVSSVDLMHRGKTTHVSVDLSTSFLKAAKINSCISVDSYILKQGNRLAFCEVEIKDEATGQLLAKGRHTKFML